MFKYLPSFNAKFFPSTIVNLCLDPFWSDWSGWSSCSKTCNEGREDRRRTCRSAEDTREESNGCIGSSSEHRGCKIRKCRQEFYFWGQWTSFSRCSRTCGGGQKMRTRDCYRSHDQVSHTTPIYCMQRFNGRAREFDDCNIFACKYFIFEGIVTDT